MSISEIAKVTNFSRYQVKVALKKYNIPRRSRSNGFRLAVAQGKVNFADVAMEKNPSWKGGRIRHAAGYIRLRLPDHHRADKNGYVLEHVVIWEQTHQNLLPKGWVVHHLNGIPDDNRPENLIGLPSRKHSKVLRAKAERIKKLEDENRQLKKALDKQQALFLLSRGDEIT